MAETVKKRTRDCIKVGDWISVPSTYFEEEDCSSDKFYGKVTFVSSESVKVKWEVDGTLSFVKSDELTKEPNYVSLIEKRNDKPKGFQLLTSALDQKEPKIDFTNEVVDNEQPSTSGTKPQDKRVIAEIESSDSSDDEPVKPKKPKKKNTTKSICKNNVAQIEGENDEVSEDEANVLDYDSEESDNEGSGDIGQDSLEDGEWKLGGWKVDPRGGGQPYGPRISLPLYDDCSELEYLIHFLPVKFFKEIVVPSTNNFAASKQENFKEFSYNEFIHFLGIMYAMEVYKLPERRMYWKSEEDGIFPPMNFGKIMARNRFEDLLKFLQFSNAENQDQQILDFLDAANANLKAALSPGDTVCLDESMVKSYHRNLKGKMKIKRKPRPIGNEFKTVCDGRSKIVTHMELYEGKGYMATKEHVKELGATTATCLRLTESLKGSGRVVIADSWFGSVKSAVQLMNQNGLYSILLVKTAHKLYPRQLLSRTNLTRGKWVSATNEIDGVELQAVKFLDLQEKQFISTSSCSIPGPPRNTKHCGKVARPLVAFQYLESAAGIDIHNHVRTGSLGLEDVWHTKNPIHRQFAGILGFLFTNAYLAYNYFRKTSIKHVDFKIKLANLMVTFDPESAVMTRPKEVLATEDQLQISHGVVKLSEKGVRRQKPCFFCQHGRGIPKKVLTSYYCFECGIDKPLCPPTSSRKCFELHISHGMPTKRRFSKK